MHGCASPCRTAITGVESTFPSQHHSKPGGEIIGIALTLNQNLDDQHINYEVMTHARTSSSSSTAAAGHVSGDDFAKAVVLKGDRGYFMVVIPATRHVALSEVSHRLNEPV